MKHEIKQFDGTWFPSHESHMIEWMQQVNCRVDGQLTYQYSKFQAAMNFVKNVRVAIDVGGHVGMWSRQLAKRFDAVHSFEPVEQHRACFALNVTAPNVMLYEVALGDKEGTVQIATSKGSSGDSYVNGSGDIPLVRLDSYPIQNVDFMKLDCEGYELFALRGGEELLKRCHPTIIVEQKPGRAQKFGLGEKDAVPYLESLGAKLRKEISGDFIMTWDN